MKDNNIGCLVYRPAYYWWNSVHFVSKDYFHRPDALWIPKDFDCSITRLDGEKEVERVLEEGGVSFFDLPRFYHGVVRRTVLHSIKERAGVYVPGASPDMAFSLALGLVLREYVHLDFPVSVFGASRGSGGGRTAERKHHGRLEDQKHLPRETIDLWDRRIPRIWSEQTIYPQTVVEVLKRFDLDRPVHFEMLYASMLVNEPYLWRDVLPLAAAYCRASPENALRMVKALVRKIAGKALRRIRASSGTMAYDVRIASDVGQCMHILSELDFSLPASSSPVEHFG